VHRIEGYQINGDIAFVTFSALGNELDVNDLANVAAQVDLCAVP